MASSAQDKNRKRETPGASPDGGQVPRDLTRREILFGLFFFPQVVFLAARYSRRWRRALLMVTVLSVLCGTGLGLVRLPTVYTKAVAWARWFGDTVGALWMEDGRLYWERPEELPYTTRYDRWLVEFAEEGSELQTSRRKGPERRGVWITHAKVLVWWLTNADTVASLTILQAGEGGPAMDLSSVWPDGMRVSGGEFERQAKSKLVQAIPMFFVFHWVEIWVPVVLYALLFSVVTSVLRGPLITGGLRAALCVTLYASIPPLIVATLYTALDIPFLDFHRVFVGTLFVYLLMVFAGLRRRAVPEG